MRGGGQGHTGGKNNCAGGHAKLFRQPIYFANPRPNPGSQSSSWFCRGLGRRDLWIIWEYSLATAIAVWSLTQPCTCERVNTKICQNGIIVILSLKYEIWILNYLHPIYWYSNTISYVVTNLKTVKVIRNNQQHYKNDVL